MPNGLLAQLEQDGVTHPRQEISATEWTLIWPAHEAPTKLSMADVDTAWQASLCDESCAALSHKYAKLVPALQPVQPSTTVHTFGS
jgi:hypothetical protein